MDWMLNKFDDLYEVPDFEIFREHDNVEVSMKKGGFSIVDKNFVEFHYFDTEENVRINSENLKMVDYFSPCISSHSQRSKLIYHQNGPKKEKIELETLYLPCIDGHPGKLIVKHAVDHASEFYSVDKILEETLKPKNLEFERKLAEIVRYEYAIDETYRAYLVIKHGKALEGKLKR